MSAEFPSPDDLDEVLRFLNDVGYQDLYVGPEVRARLQAPGAPAPQRPPSRPTAPARRPPAPKQTAPPPRRREPPPRHEPPPRQDPSQPPALAATGIDPESADGRRRRLGEVREKALRCMACRLCERRQNVVFGSGHPDADLLFIGEGPGAEEDARGLPFVGPAGELLTKIIQAIQLRRDDVYIANMVKCRPPGNRDPREDEVQACRGFLEQQVDLIQPKLIVALGRVAAQALLDRKGKSLKSMRGAWHRFRGIPVRVTYHPAALLRDAGYKRPTWEDMQLVRDELQRLRSGG